MVKDTGIGISKKDLGKIFEPHYQGVLSDDIENLGAGLGLNLCKEIVELFNRTIVVHRKKMKGQVFYLISFYPLKILSMTEPQKKIFLVVDDHVLIRLSLELIIQELFLGAIVWQANSLEDARAVLSSQTIHYMVIDISFPEGNSLSFVSNLMKEQPQLKILVYTGYEDDFYALSYLRAGASGFLNKQRSEDEIKTALTNLVIKGKHISPNLQNKILEAFLRNQPVLPIEELSTREFEVAKLLVDGLGNLEIANILNTKQNTISTIKSRIFQKLGISNLPELIEIFKFYKDKTEWKKTITF